MANKVEPCSVPSMVLALLFLCASCSGAMSDVQMCGGEKPRWCKGIEEEYWKSGERIFDDSSINHDKGFMYRRSIIGNKDKERNANIGCEISRTHWVHQTWPLWIPNFGVYYTGRRFERGKPLSRRRLDNSSNRTRSIRDPRIRNT